MPDSTPISGKDRVEKQVDDVLDACVRDCADCILMFDRDDYAGKESYKYRNQIMQLFAQSNQQAVQKALEGLLEQQHVYNAKSTDGVLNEPNTGVLAVPIESIQALKDSYDKKVQ